MIDNASSKNSCQIKTRVQYNNLPDLKYTALVAVSGMGGALLNYSCHKTASMEVLI